MNTKIKYTKLKSKKIERDSAITRRSALINYLKSEGAVEEKYPDIAKEIGTSERSFYRTLKELRESGLVTIKVLYPEYFCRRLEWKGGKQNA